MEIQVLPRPRIMVVEDEAIVARDLALRLVELGYEVAGTAASGREALDLAASTHPALAFMDIRIQGPMDGVETASRLWKGMRIPVIFLTAHSDRTTIRRATAAHPFGYLVKPPDEYEIVTAVEVALSRFADDQAARRIARAVAGASLGVIIASPGDPEPRIVHCNDAFARMTGWPAADIFGRSPWFIDGGGGDSEARRRLTESLRLGKACRAEWPCVDRAGAPFVADVSLSPVRDAEGRTSHFVFCFESVTAPDSAEGD